VQVVLSDTCRNLYCLRLVNFAIGPGNINFTGTLKGLYRYCPAIRIWGHDLGSLDLL
jgi:hypothetical protein